MSQNGKRAASDYDGVADKIDFVRDALTLESESGDEY